MSHIHQAVLLAAGEGSRLRSRAASKPLCEVAGKPLIAHAIERLAEAGIKRVVVVTGYAAADVREFLASRDWPAAVETIDTPDWLLPNGVSALAASPLLGGEPALLAMCDHLVEPELYALLAEQGAGEGLVLGIDRRLGHDWIDPDDVTRVATKGDRIVAIGKHLEPFDAHDTGVFAVSAPFFDELASLDAPSISQAVTQLAAKGWAKVVDCRNLSWIDVDDPRALDIAENWLAPRREQTEMIG